MRSERSIDCPERFGCEVGDFVVAHHAETQGRGLTGAVGDAAGVQVTVLALEVSVARRIWLEFKEILNNNKRKNKTGKVSNKGVSIELV